MTDFEYYELKQLLESKSNQVLNDEFIEWHDMLISVKERLANSNNGTDLIIAKGNIRRRLHCYATVIAKRNTVVGKRAFRLIEES